MDGSQTTAPLNRPPFAVPAELIGRGVALRPQTEGDLNFLRDLYISLRWDELAPVIDWTEARKIAFLEEQFGFQHRHYTEYYTRTDFMIVEAGGKPVGRLYLDRGHPKDLRIVDIGFLPEWRRQGLGTAFITAVQGEARAEGKFVSIHVETFNPARRLYHRMGFREISQNGCYWLMEWHP